MKGLNTTADKKRRKKLGTHSEIRKENHVIIDTLTCKYIRTSAVSCLLCCTYIKNRMVPQIRSKMKQIGISTSLTSAFLAALMERVFSKSDEPLE